MTVGVEIKAGRVSLLDGAFINNLVGGAWNIAASDSATLNEARDRKMMRVLVKTSSTKDFSGRAREAARLADKGPASAWHPDAQLRESRADVPGPFGGRWKLMAQIMEKPMRETTSQQGAK